MFSKRLPVVGAVLLTLLAGTPFLANPAAAGEHRAEIGIQGGLQAPDEHLTGEEDFLDEVVGTGGARLALFLSDHWGLAADGLYSVTETMFPQGDATTIAGRGAIEWYPTSHANDAHFFVSGGAGWMSTTMDSSAYDFTRPFASLGIGQRIALSDAANFRWELRGDHTFYERTDIVDEDMIQAELLLGLSLGFGGKFVDTDGDGISDRKDRCLETPIGAYVDEHGCAIDSDGDGVADGIDTCADTPAGWRVDARGCPVDSDGDDVPDGADKCPNTPRGTQVDANGCTMDKDGDGVDDARDRCPDTPEGAVVDATGCPKDSDSDGVFDGLDRCPNTARGSEVDQRGCPKLFEEKRDSLTLEGVNFESGSNVLMEESKAILDRVAMSLKAWPEVNVEVGGHTDSQGGDAFNLNLSDMRSKAVLDYLVGKGVGAGQLTSRGYGETQPVADNGTRDGRAKNRRVELKRKK